MRVVAVVNEPGEFHELLKLARLLRERRGTETAFVFIRPDYVAIKRHGEICTRAKIPYIHASQSFSIDTVPFALNDVCLDDYFPTFQAAPDMLRSARFWVRKFTTSMEWRSALKVPPRARWLSRVGIGVTALYKLGGIAPNEGLALHLARFHQTLRRIRAMKLFATAVIRWTEADLVLMGQDFAASENTVFARTALKLGVPTAILPFAMGTTKEINESLYSSPAHVHGSDLFSRVFERFAPHWINIYRGRALVRAPAGEAAAYIVSDMDTPLPWLPQSGCARLLAPSQQAYDYYVGAGMSSDNVVLTGSLNDCLWGHPGQTGIALGDSRSSSWFERMVEINVRQNIATEAVRATLGRTLMAPEGHNPDMLRRLKFFFGGRFEPDSFEQRMGALNRRLSYGLPAKSGRRQLKGAVTAAPRPTIVVSWVTDQYGREGPPLEFKQYDELSRAWATSLRSVARDIGATVVISLHPTLEFDKLRYLEDEFGFLVWRGQLSEIIHTAHVFVACVSSTLIWANNLNVPSLNYDCYRYGYREFDEAGCIVTTETHFDFEMELRRLALDDAYRAELNARSKDRQGYWGFYDGLSEDRLLKAIDILIVDANAAKGPTTTYHTGRAST